MSKWLGDKHRNLAPATVEKLRVTFGRSFELARKWNLPGAEINPVRAVPRFLQAADLWNQVARRFEELRPIWSAE